MCLNVWRCFAEKLSKHYIQLPKERERKDSQLGSSLANYLADIHCSADFSRKKKHDLIVSTRFRFDSTLAWCLALVGTTRLSSSTLPRKVYPYVDRPWTRFRFDSTLAWCLALVGTTRLRSSTFPHMVYPYVDRPPGYSLKVKSLQTTIFSWSLTRIYALSIFQAYCNNSTSIWDRFHCFDF